MQSPINILTQEVLYDPLLPRFDLSDYQVTDGVHMELVNKGGRTVEVEYFGAPLYIKDGGLPTAYKLHQFHFHWGAEDARGSEHCIDGDHFPMEMHIVHHRNHTGSTNVATHQHGLAVLGFLFKLVDKDNENLNEFLLDHFSKIATPERKTEIPAFALSKILPDIAELDFYRYNGSLTTPPCYETVIWSVSTQFIYISESQLNTFRDLYGDEQQHLVDDFRPLQELNHRVVYTTDEEISVENPRNSAVTGRTKNVLANILICCGLYLI
ncbi:carbonic anhydrase 4-like [Physella acuta]|uniref:carbonic anhydrase 4-like n=1 Tax=Physella acuta TaxID=109671 RepID=UPI0027DC4842|nr:carbonic anhydrase 4-like [Physella acuta]